MPPCSPDVSIVSESSKPYRTISFHKNLIPSILSGRKTATTRIGRRKLKPGELLFFCDDSRKPLGILEIERVNHCRIEDLDDKLALAENLPSAEVLKTKLAEIYGDRLQKEMVTVIYFRLMETLEHP